MKHPWTAASLMLALLAGCSSDTSDTSDIATESAQRGGERPSGLAEASGETVVARYQGGILTAADLDHAILQRGLAAEAHAAEDRSRWLGELARKLVFEQLLLEEARLIGADRDPEMRQAERQIRREVYSEIYLRQHSEELPPLTDSDLQAFHDDRLERYQRPERRRTYHIFKRHRDGADRGEVGEQLLELRRRVLAGENFSLLARDHSDSETRHQDGLLGVVERGMFSDDFDRVVFALEEGVPSQPVVNSQGGHLFLATTVLPARSVTLDEVRTLIRAELEAERRADRQQELANQLPRPANSFVPDLGERTAILRGNDPQAILLRLGDFSLTLGQFQQQVEGRRRAAGAKAPKGLAAELFENILQRETIYQHQVGEGLPAGADAVIERRLKVALIDHFARRRMLSQVERNPLAVQEFFENHQMRYATPARVRLTRLRIPVTKSSTPLMATLEEARTELDAGKLDLNTLAERHGGTVEEIGPITGAALRGQDPAAMRFAFLLKPGEHSPPYTTQRHLTLFKVSERREPEPRALALIRDRVVRDYLTQNSGPVFRQLSEERLSEAGFELALQ